LKLYELSHEYQAIEDKLATVDNAEDAQSVTTMLDGVTSAIEDKLLAIARVVKNLDAEADAIKAEEKRLAERRGAIENNVRRLKDYAQEHMEQSGIDHAKDDLFTVALQNSPPSVQVDNESAIPEDYWRHPAPSVDKRALLDALKSGEDIPGVSLRQSRSLRIR